MAEILRDDAGAALKAARKAAGDFGKFYTPECLCVLLARLATVGGLRPSRILDPACGCGSLLIFAGRVLGDAFYAGQEINAESVALARKNLAQNGFEHFEIECGDTLADPVDWQTKFDCVLANPPFSVAWDPDACVLDERFGSAYAPKSKADLAFVQHGLYWLDEGGAAAYILFPGALYRSGAEENIRAQFLPYVRAVIALPPKLFEETSIATVGVVFEKKQPADDRVYFFDASEMFEEKLKKLNVISDGQIDEICDAVLSRKTVEYQSAVVERLKIAENGFNLSPSAWIEKKITRSNPYDGMTSLSVIEDGEAWAKYSYFKQMKALAHMRKSLGFTFSKEFYDADVDGMKPKTLNAFMGVK